MKFQVTFETNGYALGIINSILENVELRHIDPTEYRERYSEGNLGITIFFICAELQRRQDLEDEKRITQSILSRKMNKVFGFTGRKKK